MDSRRNLGFALLAGVAALCVASPDAATAREPQFPLKTDRVIYTDEQIHQARDNIAKYAKAKELADGAVAAADAWLEWPDAKLRALIPTADVPRAFNVGTAGCPKCGKKIYEKGGTYPWKLDLKEPFKVRCPVCGGVFPDNDFAAYYASGFKDKQYLEGDFVDDGWGWVGPDGERYWFVGYANHWTLHRHVVPAIGNLGRAYLFTGDKRYAHKAAVLLDRVAEVYPAMDYHNQSRYGQLVAKDGGKYPGKLVNLIWACGNLGNMACAYDAVWETIDGDTELEQALGKTGEEIRANIEANLLEEGIDGIFAGEIRGNFGMHQRALVYATLARQHGKTDEWLDTIFTRTGCSGVQTGLNYALYNLVYRDGAPYETSPGYNSGWVSSITQIAETLKGTRRDVYALPKTKRLYDLILDMVNVGRHTPSVGDSGNIDGGCVAKASLYAPAYQAYGDPRYLERLTLLDAVGENCFNTYASLFCPPIETSDARPKPQASRLLDGYGMGIVNNPADTISAALYYGFKGGHGHFDRLNFDLFAFERPMMPDTGYPDFMNGYVPGIYTWSKNTIAHNTVTVDASRQSGNEAGTVNLFAAGSFARVIDVDAPATYPQCRVYRRHLVMVDVDLERSYFVDFFTVEGGGQHDYSLHGPPGACEVIGGTWTTQEKGTLAGEDVEVAQIYDDPARAAEGYAGTYYGYVGSGFQHLFNVQKMGTVPSERVLGKARSETGLSPFSERAWLAQYAHKRDAEARLRIRVLAQPDTEIILADAQISPVKHKDLLKYIIARRKGEDLESRFVSVIEPYKGDPFIADASRVELAGGALAVVVKRQDGHAEVILHNPGRNQVALDDCAIKTDAAAAVVTLDGNGDPARVFFAHGSALSVKERQFDASPTPKGAVVSVVPDKCQVRVRLEGSVDTLAVQALAGRVVHFENALRRTAHPIAAATLDGNDLVLTTRDDLLVGRAKLTAVEADALRTNALRTDTAFMFAPIYRGTYVSDPGFRACYPMTVVETPDGEDTAIRLAAPLPEGHAFEVGADAWIVNVGPGDRLDAPALCEWTAEHGG